MGHAANKAQKPSNPIRNSTRGGDPSAAGAQLEQSYQRSAYEAFGGFTYRLQLNVRNVLNEDDVIPVTALTTGQVVKLATVEPRVIVVTFGVNF